LRAGRGRLTSIGLQLAGLREMVVMMFGHGYGAGWPVWEAALMWVGMLAFLGVLIWAAYAVAGNAFRRRGSGQDAAASGRILDERLARGEIDTDQYTRLREALAASGTQRPAETGSRN
jgi:uncharacterized membrane protein